MRDSISTHFSPFYSTKVGHGSDRIFHLFFKIILGGKYYYLLVASHIHILSKWYSQGLNLVCLISGYFFPVTNQAAFLAAGADFISLGDREGGLANIQEDLGSGDQAGT